MKAAGREAGGRLTAAKTVLRHYGVRSPDMHELSIAMALVEVAEEAAQSLRAARVNRLFVRLGARADVVAEALRFSFDLAAEGTIVQGARLELEPVEGADLLLSAMEVVDAEVPPNC